MSQPTNGIPSEYQAAYEGFGGRIGRTFRSSTPDWPARPTPPDGAPNVVVVLVDDLGFADLGCYGSEIRTPNIDGLAGRGLRYANFHVTPLCSPTRAALLTGLNSHAAGMGFVANVDPGFPGYVSEMPRNQPTLAEIFRANGYSTFMLGKWHLSRDSDLSEAGDRGSWPLQRGFDEYYGFLDPMTNLHHPHRLYDGNSVVDVDRYPDGYYLTDDLTDRAERMIKGVKGANPSKPFFMYFAHGCDRLLKFALDQAKQNIRAGTDNNVWRVTGPGIMTKLRNQGGSEWSQLMDGIELLDVTEIRKIVGFRWDLAYKDSSVHWTNFEGSIFNRVE